MLNAIIESFGVCMGYVLIVACASTIWDMVIRAFTRGY